MLVKVDELRYTFLFGHVVSTRDSHGRSFSLAELAMLLPPETILRSFELVRPP